MKTAILLLGLLAVSLATTTSDDNAADALQHQLGSMQNALNDDQSAHQALYESQVADCDAEVAFRNAEIDAATSALSNSQAAQTKCENAQVATHEDHARANNYIIEVQGVLSQLAFQRSQEEQAFNYLVEVQLNPAIAALQELYTIINGVAEEAVSFVQVTSHINKIFKHMSKAGRISKFGSVLTFLIQQEENSDVTQLLPLLYEIEDALQSEKQAGIDAEAAAIDVYNTNVGEYVAILTNLQNTVDNINAYLEELAACIAQETEVSAAASAKQLHNTDSLNHAVDMCLALAVEFKHATEAREAEQLLLQKLKSYVDEQAEAFGDFGNDGDDVLAAYQNSLAQMKSAKRAEFIQISVDRLKKSSGPAQYNCLNCRKGFLQKNMGF